jgi:hypothetical protein
MIIGGYALPLYGRIRTTLDIDLAVAIKTDEEIKQILRWLQSIDFEVTNYSPQNPLIIIVDRREELEVELWLKPDGIVFDKETLRRRRRAKLDENTEAWIISPEDFIVNKLARPDRGAVDEQDVKSVLVRQGDKLDRRYLNKRARDAEVIKVLESIQAL